MPSRDEDTRDDARAEFEALQDAETVRELRSMVKDLRAAAAEMQSRVPEPGEFAKLLRMNLQMAAIEHALSKF